MQHKLQRASRRGVPDEPQQGRASRGVVRDGGVRRECGDGLVEGVRVLALVAGAQPVAERLGEQAQRVMQQPRSKQQPETPPRFSVIFSTRSTRSKPRIAGRATGR